MTSKAAARKRAQRAKKFAKLNEAEYRAFQREENQKQRERRQRAKRKKIEEENKATTAASERQLQKDDIEVMVLSVLTAKGNKQGLRDEALKKAVDEYRERLAGDGKTFAEQQDEHLNVIDDKLMSKLAGVRKKLRSAE